MFVGWVEGGQEQEVAIGLDNDGGEGEKVPTSQQQKRTTNFKNNDRLHYPQPRLKVTVPPLRIHSS